MNRLLIPALLASVLVNSAADWPQWRGPNRDGISQETGLLKQWPADGPPLVWKATGLGTGFSSVSVSKGRIFTMGDVDDACCVLALNEKDGKLLWKTPIGAPDNSDRQRPGTRCTPTVDGDLVFVISARGDLVCLEAATGKERWKKDFARDFKGRAPSWRYSESPLVDGDKLVCSPGGTSPALVALNKRTGEVLWQANVEKLGPKGKTEPAYSGVVVSEAAGVRQYVVLLGHGVAGIRAADGKFLWGYNQVANKTATIPTPVTRGDYVLASSSYGEGGLGLLKLDRSADGVNASEVYYLPPAQAQNHHGGMILVGDHLYFGEGHNNGKPMCIEFQTGKVAWKEERGAGSGSAAIVFADGNFVFRHQSGTVSLVAASPAAYKQLGKFEQPGRSTFPAWAHPVIANGRLYLRDMDLLFSYDVKAK